MKKLFLTLSLVFVGTMAFAQNNGNQGSFVISEFRVEDNPGPEDEIILRLSGPAANVPQSLIADPTYSSRISTLTLSKDEGSNQGNGSTSLWRVSIDVSSISDPATGDIELTVQGGPYCCNIPQGGIVVRSKGR